MDDSFNVDDFEIHSRPRILKKPPRRVAYGRRGNDPQLRRHSSLQEINCTYDQGDDENVSDHCGRDSDGSLFRRSLSVGHPVVPSFPPTEPTTPSPSSSSSLLMGENIDGHFNAPKWESDGRMKEATMTTPSSSSEYYSTVSSSSASGNRRLYSRSLSMTMTSTTSTTSSHPKLPPKLIRSFSIQPGSHRSSSVSSMSSSSMEQHFDIGNIRNGENVHANSDSGSSTSPKRAADYDGNNDSKTGHLNFGGGQLDENHIGTSRRKKTKSDPRSFFDNNFSSLHGQDRNNVMASAHTNAFANSDRARFFSSSNHSSFSNLARRGSTGSSWALSPSKDEEHDHHAAGTSFHFLSPATTVCRKRSSQDSPLSDDDGTPPKSRSRSKTSATPEHIMAKESPFQTIMSIDSKRSQEDEYGIDKSFFSPLSNGEHNRSNPTLDVSMTDDEVNVTADDSGDDNTVSPDDPFPSQPSASSSELSSKDTMPRKLEIGNASVDDIIKSMPSYPSLKFLAKKLHEEESSDAFTRATMTVPVDPKWSTERREAFLQWTSKTLGFKLSNGGNKTFLVQIPWSRGSTLLVLLNNVVRICKERGMEGTSPSIDRHSTTACAFTFSAAKSLRPPKAVRKDFFPRSLNLATPNGSVVNSPWCDIVGETDELAQRMKGLNMNQNHRKKSNGTATFNTRLSIDSIASSDFSISRYSRPSLEHCTSNSDLMAHLHGSSTPVPRSRMGRPPRTSLQSVASSTSLPQAIGSKLDASPFLPLQLDCEPSSFGGADFTLTPRTEPLDTWGSRPQNDRDWGDSEPVIQTLVDELYKRFEENRRIAGFTAEDDEENFVDDAETHRLGLDFEGASNYRDGPESPLSAASQNGEAEYYDDDQGSQVVLSQESLDFFKVNNDISQFGELEKQSRDAKRRHTSMAKRRRMSMFSSSVTHTKSFLNSRKSLFIRPSRVSTSTPAFILESGPNFCRQAWSPNIARVEECPVDSTIPPFHDPEIMLKIFSFLPQNDIMSTAALVSKSWFDASAHSYANFMRRSVGCGDINSDDELDDDCSLDGNDGSQKDSFAAMEKSWPYLTATFPWAMFLSDGAFKRVYKVFNRSHRTEEAVSVMDLDAIKKTGNMSVVGAELAVSVLLSSLVRLGVCPNFVVTRAAFTSSFEPPAYSWGDSNNRRPKGNQYVSPEVKKRPPKEPKHRGRYQYIRQELCDEGDVEEYLKAQPDESIPPDQARYILFQIAFAIHAAADRFSLKHYDVKLLNVFLKRVRSDKQGDVILRYGLGEHTFALRQNRDQAIIAKLADYGTANVDSGSNGQQVTIAQFTTFENTPPDFLLLGDKAQQGHGHDYFGLGLCMLHLMTGHAPYEEILEDVYCPDNLKRELKKVWENEEEPDFSVVRSLVLADCFMDDEGHILEGEPDETFYDTLYKFLVLFGIPDKDPAFAESKAMKAIKATLTSESRRNLARKGRCSKRMSSDASKFHSDRRKYSLTHGNNTFITRARESLLSMKGGMDLLLSLVDFNPQTRATALDVLNSEFMAPLRETSGATYSEDDDVSSFTAFATHY